MDYFGNYIHLDYDENGLSKVTHSDGCYLRVQSQDWLIREIEYFDGQVNQQLLRCEYNARGQLIYCRSHQFGEIFHDYDENGYMVSWRDTQATQTDVVYDERGRVISTQASGGYYADRFAYDEANRCTTYYDAEGGISHFWYNDNALVTKEEDPLGRIKETEWDLSLKLSETDALGRTLSYRYNDYGELTEVILPNEEKLQYRYNEKGLLTERILARGERWRYEYDERGALSKLTSPYGLTWHYQYDEKGRLIRLDYLDETYQSYEYDEHTYQLIGRRDSRGELTSFTQDLFGRITQLTLPDNSQYRYEYSQAHANPDGSLTKLTTPEGSIQHFRYNSERLLTEAVDGNGNKTKYTYGAFDLLHSQTLPNGETLTFRYDKLTRLTEVKNSQGDSYRYEYDKAGQLISETDFTGRVRSYAYDQAGRLTRQTQADGSIETYSYDEEDKLLSRQTWQVKKTKVDIKVDTTGKPEKKTLQKLTALFAPTDGVNGIAIPEGYALAHEVSYAYTKKTGQLSKTVNTQYLPFNATHITEFEYDEQHRLIAEIQDGERIEVELDKYGRQTGFSLPNGGESAVRISQRFNQYGELTQFQVDDHNPLNLSYDKLGRQTRKQNENGFILAEHFSPSGLLQAQGGGWHNNLTEEQLDNYQPNHTYPIAGTQISRKWQYDKAFNLTHTQDNHWGATEYRVNKNGQVTDVLNGIRSSEHYRYDSQLNLTQKVQRETNENGQYQLQAANDATYGIKHRHGRITRYGNKTYKYDELGRLQSKTETKKGFRPVTTYYKWNSQSQLVELHSPHKGTWRYEYDAFGRRITKYQVQTDQAATTDPNNPYKNQLIDMPIRPNQDYWHKISELWETQEQQAQNETTENPAQKQITENQGQAEKTPVKTTALLGYRYLYKQNQLVAEAPLQITATDGNPALQAEGRQQILQANWNEAIYWLYQEDDFTPTARYEKGQLHYTVADQVGTITELLTEDGYIDYRQKLNLWGEAEIDGHRHYAANDSNPLKCNHRFVGQYYDEESELHYNRFRYYSPETGQYLSHDPIGLLGGFNPYGYVGIPTAFVEPLGLQVCPKWKKEQRVNIYNAQRPSRGLHTTKHVSAKAEAKTMSQSLVKGTVDGKPEASYLQNLLEKLLVLNHYKFFTCPSRACEARCPL
ncbi:RHS repeat protein [Aggregatibacter kilianii]|uniref:RHS repeat protein n=1 Tax=Aggregatibacter kilianii TaxID=2025884 RepID=UPI0013A63CC9|nr:RHS repeat protein [Aggregatibacter kilianii]